METISVVIGWIVAIFIGAMGAVIVWKILTNKIDLTNLISETNGHASLSRFQFLIFTFVIAMSLFLIVTKTGEFPAISAELIGLLGISGGSYVVSKGIQSGGNGTTKKDTTTN